MVVRHLRALALTSTLILVATTAAAAGLTARLGATVVREGERVQLLLRGPADGSMVAPNLSPLEQDFEILGTQQSQRVSIVNGRRDASIDWTVTLLPRTTGDLAIPAIQAGALSSEPLSLRVAEAGPPPSRADAPDLFVESTVDEASPYVQGEVRYTVRVYDGIGIRGGGLTEPNVPGARVTAVGEGRTYEEEVGGRPYVVHEREYAIHPQTSGSLRIAPVTLEARIDDPRARRGSPFDDMFGGRDPFGDVFGRAGFRSSLFDDVFNPGRAVRVRSNPVELEVQARPDGTEGWFLPAKHVELVESFEPAAPRFQVGEAVERTVTLRALGASAEQLPAFEIPTTSGLRQYDEGSRDGTVPTPEGTVSVREQTVALVPSEPGPMTLPAVEVAWWDATTETKQVARLPERSIDVLPAAGAPLAQAKAAPQHAPAAPAVEAPSIDSPPAMVADQSGDDVPALIGLGLLVLAAAAGAAYVQRRRATTDPSGSASSDATARPAERLAELRRACDGDDARRARDALLAWARAEYGVGAPKNPRAVAQKLGSSEFETEAAKLDRSLYAPGADPFEGEAFWLTFRAARASRGRVEVVDSDAVLPELYPLGPGAPSGPRAG